MKKKYLFMATAAIMMAGCASDDLVGDENISSGETPIAFSMNTPNATRAESPASGNDAATKLNNMFIVWGEKNEENGYKADADDLVFKNYLVKHDVTSGQSTTSTYTAGSTTSNTNGWEYVGVTPISNNLTPATPSKQTIKYWDDKASSYTFTAVSALETNISDGKVIIAKTEGEDKPTQTTTPTPSVNTKGYTITIKDGASMGDIYVADRVNIAKGSGYAHTSPVTLTFRNFQSKIRFGIYETVPGYKVVITGLKYNTDNNQTPTEEEHPKTTGSGDQSTTDKSFGITGDFVVAGDNTTYTVTYYENATANSNNNNITSNKAQVTVGNNSSKQTYLNTTGENWLSTVFNGVNDTNNKTIGETATGATWDKGSATDGSDSWTAILPNTGNTTPLTLVVSYELYSEDTGEKIAVDYKAVKVPAQYCQWKPNYAYTYLFKITDKSADLNPITFDACVVTEQTGNQETITTVDEPSITTYVKGKTASDEYAGGDIIYAFAQDGTTTAMSSTNMKLYKVTSSDATNFKITEASVKHALEHTGGKITATEITSSSDGNDKPSYAAIPREDNDDTNGRGITGMKWTATANTYYAIEYIKDANTKYYKIVKVASSN